MTLHGIALVAWLLAIAPGGTVGAPNDAQPKLPEGELQLVAGNNRGANFLILDGIARTGDSVEFWFYNASVTPTVMPSGESVVHMLEHDRIDCRRRTVTRLFSGGYGSGGNLLVSLPQDSPRAIAPDAAHGFFARVLCDGVKLPEQNKVTGYRAAMEKTKRMLGGT